MNNRKTSIELMRFLGSAMVVFVHCSGFIYADSPLAQFAFPIVDFFFMVTGYFTMSDASKAITMQKDGSSSSKSRFLPEAADTIRYVWHKAKDIFALYIFALILAFVIRTAQKDVFSMSETLQELFHFKWEFLMLHMLGFNHAPAFNVDYLLGPGWFISSMIWFWSLIMITFSSGTFSFFGPFSRTALRFSSSSFFLCSRKLPS